MLHVGIYQQLLRCVTLNYRTTSFHTPWKTTYALLVAIRNDRNMARRSSLGYRIKVHRGCTQSLPDVAKLML